MCSIYIKLACILNSQYWWVKYSLRYSMGKFRWFIKSHNLDTIHFGFSSLHVFLFVSCQGGDREVQIKQSERPDLAILHMNSYLSRRHFLAEATFDVGTLFLSVAMNFIWLIKRISLSKSDTKLIIFLKNQILFF